MCYSVSGRRGWRRQATGQELELRHDVLARGQAFDRMASERGGKRGARPARVATPRRPV